MKLNRFLLCAVVLAAALFGPGAPAAAPPAPPEREHDIVVQGKAYAMLRRPVTAYFMGETLDVAVRAGQPVKKDQGLFTYELAPEVIPQLRRRVSQDHLNDIRLRITQLGIAMAKLDNDLRVAEIEKQITALEGKKQEVERLRDSNMASEESLRDIERELAMLRKSREAAKGSIELQRRNLRRQLERERERLALESELAKDDMALLRKQLGPEVEPGSFPREVAARSPMKGHVIWINPLFREGAALTPGYEALRVGVLDPMVLRAHVFEAEAAMLRVGEEAVVEVDSLPGERFGAELTRISWTPVTPNLDQPSYYEVELQVDNPDLLLKDGYKTRIIFPKTSPK